MTRHTGSPITRRCVSLAAAAALAITTVTIGRAAEPGARVNVLTFSQPVALPGTSLPAGSYVFEVANPASSADVVRVRIRGTGLPVFAGFTRRVARPHHHTQPVTFGEARRGEPVPILAWSPGGLASTYEFMYP